MDEVLIQKPLKELRKIKCILKESLENEIEERIPYRNDFYHGWASVTIKIGSHSNCRELCLREYIRLHLGSVAAFLAMGWINTGCSRNKVYEFHPFRFMNKPEFQA